MPVITLNQLADAAIEHRLHSQMADQCELSPACDRDDFTIRVIRVIAAIHEYEHVAGLLPSFAV